MQLSTYLQGIANIYGPDKMEGGMVFVSLDRPVDNVIRYAMALDHHNHGKPSPWSHCFLIAGPYAGAATPILDCTIRDEKNAIIWNSSLDDDIKEIVEGLQGKAGKIYAGKIGDYDDARVHNLGVYFLPGLTGAQRKQIVTAAQQLQAQGYAYDLPGLVRELIRLMLGITIPPGDHKMLFCSAFLATTYRNALGSSWQVAPTVPSVDVTPDELWYSDTGVHREQLEDHNILVRLGAPAFATGKP